MDKFLKALPYYGGKSARGLSKWIASILPWDKNSIYIEPYAGMASVLLSRESVETEILNDINNRIINWWCIIRDQPEEFGWLVENTPNSRKEFMMAFDKMDDMSLSPLYRALAFHTFVIQNIVHGDNHGSWRRCFSANLGSLGRWNSDRIIKLSVRLHDVQLENRDALSLLDSVSKISNTVIYCDPPYKHANTTAYKYNKPMGYELTDNLLVQYGKVAISGYGNEWDHLGWTRYTKETARIQIGGPIEKREEVLWINF